jgi:RNA polymerase sigma-70 factor (ECF subfamily)
MPDEELLKRIARGEQLAFEALYSRYGTPVMRFLYRCSGDQGLAEDLTQEVFVKVYRAATRWRPTGTARAWLFQIARRHWWNRSAWLRRRRPVHRRLAEHATVDDQLDDAPGAAERAGRSEVGHAIRMGVLALPKRLRVVFVLVRLEGLPLAEAALIEGIPIGTVKSRLSAGERILRGRLRHLLP